MSNRQECLTTTFSLLGTQSDVDVNITFSLSFCNLFFVKTLFNVLLLLSSNINKKTAKNGQIDLTNLL